MPSQVKRVCVWPPGKPWDWQLVNVQEAAQLEPWQQQAVALRAAGRSMREVARNVGKPVSTTRLFFKNNQPLAHKSPTHIETDEKITGAARGAVEDHAERWLRNGDRTGRQYPLTKLEERSNARTKTSSGDRYYAVAKYNWQSRTVDALARAIDAVDVPPRTFGYGAGLHSAEDDELRPSNTTVRRYFTNAAVWGDWSYIPQAYDKKKQRIFRNTCKCTPTTTCSTHQGRQLRTTLQVARFRQRFRVLELRQQRAATRRQAPLQSVGDKQKCGALA